MIGPISHDALQLSDGLQRTSRPVVFDVETTGLDVRKARILSLGFRIHVDGQWRNFIIYTESCSHVSIRPHAQPWGKIRAALGPLNHPKLVLVAHNAKYDLQMLHREGVTYRGATRDTLAMLRMVDQDRGFTSDTVGRQDLRAPAKRRWTNYRLKDVAGHLLGIAPCYTPSANMDFVGYAEHTTYLAHDLAITQRLHDFLWQGLSAHQRNHCRDVQSPLAELLCEMQRTGIAADGVANYLVMFVASRVLYIQRLRSESYDYGRRPVGGHLVG